MIDIRTIHALWMLQYKTFFYKTHCHAKVTWRRSSLRLFMDCYLASCAASASSCVEPQMPVLCPKKTKAGRSHEAVQEYSGLIWGQRMQAKEILRAVVDPTHPPWTICANLHISAHWATRYKIYKFGTGWAATWKYVEILRLDINMNLNAYYACIISNAHAHTHTTYTHMCNVYIYICVYIKIRVCASLCRWGIVYHSMTYDI
jgi:hypothetical protein